VEKVETSNYGQTWFSDSPEAEGMRNFEKSSLTLISLLKMAIISMLALIGLESPVHAGECFYRVEARVIEGNAETTFISDIVELDYPTGSTKCNVDSSGRFVRREQKLEDQFFDFAKTKSRGLVIARKHVHARWFADKNELKIISDMLSRFVQAGKIDDNHFVVLLSGRFYVE
jgi:hypothetical protein